ncbi:hypothetical protein RUM44_004442 [Polyplax serrata]|uniref:Uncharacterized protein n=1 Tax=Polyplax serrata TaxID=468196 RepID=A0ABR1B2W5_POLSC
MGGSQSAPTRKISIPNEESQFIKISESVAERLKKCTEKSPEEMLKKPKEECEPTEMQTNVRDKHLNPDCDALINYYYGPSLTSIRILQEKEKELKESEEYWNRRIRSMENHHAKLNQIMENEYNKAVVEISCQTPRPPPDSPFPCCDQKNKLIQCYKKNPKEILLCAGEVTQFADCVHAKRINADKAKGCET